MAFGRVTSVQRLAVLASLLVLGLCAGSAVYIYRAQAVEQDILNRKAANRSVVVKLQTELEKLTDLLPTGTGDQMIAIHERSGALLERARELAESEEEKSLADQLQASFDHYRQDWERRQKAAKPSESVPVEYLVDELKQEIIPLCRRWRDLDFRQMEAAETTHARAMEQFAWALGLLGVAGSLSALLLGYYGARGVRRSLRQMSITIQTATGKLGLSVPAVTIADNNDFQHVHQQMEGLTDEIEKVVGKLQQREREVLRAEQLVAVGQVAAGVAHELRNPLTSIKLLVHANREEAQAHGLSREDFDIMEQEIRRMDQCLQAFLDFARPPKAVRCPTDLVPLVERALALVRGRAGKQKVSLRFTHPDEAFPVEADREQIVQVLVNLALNALDVMRRGGYLEMHLRGTDNGQVRLRVLDSGPGISPDILPHLFEPFVSVKETGLGLGLAISRQIVEGHDGTLRGWNRPEGGACFELCLPRHTRPRADIP
jgi:two-component system sensor histidine kinase HydH